jgi:GT2 family glycosyltransferase
MIKEPQRNKVPKRFRFGVVLVNYNGWDDTVECLESLMKCHVCPDVVVVDNASSEDHSQKILARFPELKWIASQENTGWSGGNNLGIRYFLEQTNPPDVIFLLNNDTIVSKDIFEVLELAMEEGFDIVGPVINEYSEQDKIQTQGTAFNRKTDAQEFFSVIPTPIDSNQLISTPVDIVNGCAVAIRHEVFEKIGLIDERFFLICEESDFCLRAAEAGFRCGVVHRSLVWHKHSVSFARAGKPIQRYYGVRNLWLLLKKHPHGKERKGPTQSNWLYCKRAYHLFCHEMELGNRPGASAVCDGIADAWLGRYGKWMEKKSWCSRWLESTMGTIWRLRGGRSES